jgi:5'-nucleotidase
LRRTRLSLAAVLALATSAGVAAVPVAATAAPGDIPVQLVTMNDFHGRIQAPTGTDGVVITSPGPDGDYATTGDNITDTVGGAPQVATAVRNAQSSFTASTGSQNTWFMGAGDLISASPYESSVFKDEPTIEVLNAMGLDASSVGNHEFDRGTTELKRISAPTDGSFSDDVSACDGVSEVAGTGCFTDSTGKHFHGTDFPYLAANVIDRTTGKPMLPPYQTFDIGGGKKLAVIGVVTETTPTIVAPDGVADVEFIDEADAVNEWVPVLQAEGIEAIGVLIHEGGTTSGAQAANYNDCAGLSGPIVDINNRVSNAVDLVVSAHTHQAYNCQLAPTNGTPRLVTSAGHYGRFVSDIRLEVNPTTGDVDRAGTYSATNVPVSRTANAAAPDVAAIVNYWVGKSAQEGNRVVGKASEDILRARDGTAVVRYKESSLGNLVAQAQLDALEDAAFGTEEAGLPEIAFMNPGGLRTDILAGEVTYKEVFDVQPFGNTVNAVTLTGADIEQVLEQQFRPQTTNPQTGLPVNNDLWLGTSAGFSYNYDKTRAIGDRVDACSIKLNGELVQPGQKYRVVANSFLVTGGDSFGAFKNGTDPVTGPVDADTAVEYFGANSPVAPPAANHATETTTPAPCPAPASATISKADPTRGEQVTVTGKDFAVGEAVTTTLADGRVLGTATADAAGTVAISFHVPLDLPAGQHTVTLTGASGETAATSFTLGTVVSDVRTVVTQLITRLLSWLQNR